MVSSSQQYQITPHTEEIEIDIMIHLLNQVTKFLQTKLNYRPDNTTGFTPQNAYLVMGFC